MGDGKRNQVIIPEGYTPEEYMSELMEKMKKGDADAAYLAALCFREGIGCTQSDANFTACLMVSANGKNEAAQELCRELGPDFFTRIGDAFYDAKIMQNALHSYLWAFKLGDRKKCVRLADMYAKGLGTERSTELAGRFLLTGAEAGVAEAQYRYSKALEKGEWVEQNEEAAVEWCLKAAGNGHINAMLSTGLHYWYDNDDVFEAEEWFKKAAENNSREGMLLLAELYTEELNEPDKAFELLTRSVAMGSKAAELDLAKWYLFKHHWNYRRIGEGAPGDHKKAAEILRRLTEEGYKEAYYYWGLCLLDGYGVPADVSRSMEWLSQAAENNSEEAQKLMGFLYAFGRDINPVWPDETVRSDFYGDSLLFNKDRDSISSSSYEGWMEYHREVKTENAVKALKWYEAAAEQGDYEAAGQICVLSEIVLERLKKSPENADNDLIEEIAENLKFWKQVLTEDEPTI